MLALVNRYFESPPDLALYQEIFSPDFVDRPPDDSEGVRGPEGMLDFASSLQRFASDTSVEIHEAFRDHDTLALLVTLRATARASGAAIEQREIVMWRFAGGRIVERWWAVDR